MTSNQSLKDLLVHLGEQVITAPDEEFDVIPRSATLALLAKAERLSASRDRFNEPDEHSRGADCQCTPCNDAREYRGSPVETPAYVPKYPGAAQARLRNVDEALERYDVAPAQPSAYLVGWISEDGDARQRVQLSRTVEPWLERLRPHIQPLFLAASSVTTTTQPGDPS